MLCPLSILSHPPCLVPCPILCPLSPGPTPHPPVAFTLPVDGALEAWPDSGGPFLGGFSLALLDSEEAAPGPPGLRGAPLAWPGSGGAVLGFLGSLAAFPLGAGLRVAVVVSPGFLGTPLALTVLGGPFLDWAVFRGHLTELVAGFLGWAFLLSLGTSWGQGSGSEVLPQTQ